MMETTNTGLITWRPDPHGMDEGDLFGYVGSVRVVETYRNSKGKFRASVGTGGISSGSVTADNIADLQVGAEAFIAAHFEKYGLASASRLSAALSVQKQLVEALEQAKSVVDAACMSDDLDGTPSDDQAVLVEIRAKIDAAILAAKASS